MRVIKSRRIRWAGHVARMVEGMSAFKILTDKPTGERPLRRFWHTWKGNIRVDLKEIGVNTSKWVHLAQDRQYWRTLGSSAFNLHVS